MKKNILFEVAVVLGLLSILIGGAGCKKNRDVHKEPVISIARMSQQERKAYIAEYLKKNYNLECDIGDVDKKQLTTVKMENYYFTTASCDDKWFTIWVSEEGEVFDTAFSLELSEGFNSLLSEKIKKYWNEYNVSNFFVFEEPSKKKWTMHDNFDELFQEEKVESIIKLFLSSNNEREQDLVKLDELKKDLASYRGMIYVYYCEDLNEISKDSFDENSYSECVELE